MSAQSVRYQTLAVAILTIATGIIGFGLFESDLRDSTIGLVSGSGISPLVILRFFYGLMALVHYLLLLESTRRVFKQTTAVHGHHIADGPLLFLLLMAVYVAMMFIFGVLEPPPDTTTTEQTPSNVLRECPE